MVAPAADAARVRAAARAVRAADRGQPRRPARQPLRDLGAAARLLPAVGEPGRGARARRLRLRRRPRAIALSDAICTALQLTEHWQDVGEDRDRGRVYLPLEDLARFGCTLDRPRRRRASGEPLRRGARARGRGAPGAACAGALRWSRAARLRSGSRSRASWRADARRSERSSGPATTCSPGRRAPARRRRLLALAGHASLERRRGSTSLSDAGSSARGIPPLRGDHARAGAANFYYGMRLLAPPSGAALCAVYAFARRVDDIGDGALPAAAAAPARRAAQALAPRDSLPTDAATARMLDQAPGSRCARAPRDPVLVALADAHERFPLPPDALQRADRRRAHGRRRRELRDLRRARPLLPPGGRLDRAGLPGDLRAARRRTAPTRAGRRAWPTTSAWRSSSRTSCATCARTPRAGASTCPAEDLRRFGLSGARRGATRRARSALADGRVAGRRRREWAGEASQIAARARALRGRPRAEWYERGLALTPLLDRRSAACVLAMSGIYHRRLLERIDADPRARPARARLAGVHEGGVAARSLLGGARTPGTGSS